jgi:ABC-type polysaccharide/polyol phosphate transport system ATPase subunit
VTTKETTTVSTYAPIGDDVAISVRDLHVTYRATIEKRPTMRQTVARLGRRQRSTRLVEAVKDLSFEVKRGTVLGVIGRNGAGKSTLMRTLAGILPPTQGRVEVVGRTSTLLSLGIGFNKDISGRENIVLGGLAAGMTRAEIDAKYDQIADFADIGEFIDMPMRSYSAGMASRLAFAVAVHQDPDILLIDEALSTGDAAFKERANDRMKELVANSSTMVLISHALSAIKTMCDECLWLDKGELVMRGHPDEVVDAYTKRLHVKQTAIVLEDI